LIPEKRYVDSLQPPTSGRNKELPVLSGFRKFALSLSIVTASLAAHAQDRFPSKPVRIVVGAPAGTAGDVTARVIADALSKQLRQPFVVDNKPGANGAVAASAVTTAAADGHTLFLSASSPMTITPHLVKKLGWNPLTSFSPVVEVGTAPLVLFVSAKSDIRSIDDLVKRAKQRGDGKMTMGILQLSMSQIAVSMFESQTGARFLSVPYKGGVEMGTALLGGEIDAGLVGLGGVAPQLGPDGGIRALGVTTVERIGSFPNVPAMREALKDYEAGSWFGLFAPAGTNPAAIQELNKAVNIALAEPQVKQLLLNSGTIPTGGAPSVLQGHMLRDHKRFGDVIEKLGVTPQ